MRAQRIRCGAQRILPGRYYEWEKLIDPEAELTFGEDTRSLHCVERVVAQERSAKDAPYHPKCLYEAAEATLPG